GHRLGCAVRRSRVPGCGQLCCHRRALADLERLGARDHRVRESHVVIYDPITFEERDILDVPCPGLTIATRDEAASTYFSNWGLPRTSITGEAPPTCLAKVNPDQASVKTFDLREWTEGRLASNFRYVGDGR